MTEVELLSDLGRLFHDGRRRVGISSCFDVQGGLPDDLVEPADDGQEISREPPPVVDLEDLPDSGRDTADDSSLDCERLVDCVSQCFEEFCFSGNSFDINKFVSLSHIIFSNENDRNDSSFDTIQKIKADVLSHLIRRVFVMLSLTKSQMDVLNRFLKAVLIFADPNSCSFARKMHAGYMSCLRHSIRHVRRSDLAVRSCFDSCLFFSIALDSALFGQEHVLACTVRFTFQDRLEQFPLFMKVCDASTGEEVAAFVFNSLKVYNAQFNKLSSIATDGASAMIGKANGMISFFKRLVSTELGTV